MTTAAIMIQDALDDINVNASESPIEASDMQKAIRTMNRMVASWGLPLGYTVVTDPSDDLTVIAGAELAIQGNLAILLAPAFDAFASPALKTTAKQAYDDMLSQVITIQPLSMPSRLPKGTGNNRGDYTNNTFYPPQGAELVQEGDGNILLE